MAGIDKDIVVGAARARDAHRLPVAGAAARSEQGRPRQRRGRRARDARAAHEVRGGREARRGPVRGRDGQGDEPAGRAAGSDRGDRRVGPWTIRSRWRWTRRAARRATRTSTRSPAANAAVALARLLPEKPDMLLDEPTNHSTRRRASRGRRSTSSSSWARSSRSPTIATSSTTSRSGSSNLDRGEGHLFEGNYSGWLGFKAKRLKDEEKQSSARQWLPSASSSGCARRRRRGRSRARRASRATTRWSPRRSARRVIRRSRS